MILGFQNVMSGPTVIFGGWEMFSVGGLWVEGKVGRWSTSDF